MSGEEELQEILDDLKQTGDYKDPEEQEDDEPEEDGEETPDVDLDDPNSDYWRELAKSQGWREDVDPKKTQGGYRKTAREFVESGKLFNSVHETKQEMRRIRDEMQAQAEWQLKAQRTAHEARIKELVKLRNEAAGEADVDGVENYQTQIDQVKTAIEDIDSRKPAKAEEPLPESVLSWNQQNAWYAKAILDPQSADYTKAVMAEGLFNRAVAAGKTADDAFAIVDAQLAKSFPPQTKTRPKAAPAESGGRPSARVASKLSYAQLSRDEQKQVDLAVDAGMYSRDDAVEMINKYRSEG